MLLYVSGDLFNSPAQVLVNTVNTVGVMGKGVALQFKKLYPDMFQQYRNLCERGELSVGKLWLFRSPNKWILNFPTKIHWRNPSRPEFIEAGLRTFRANYDRMGIHSIAFPPLGCGNGRLDFETQVQPLMEKYLRNLPIEIFVYPAQQEEGFVAEHESPEGMQEWLRTEPTSLPFMEVWQDIVAIVGSGVQLETRKTKTPYLVKIDADGSGLTIQSEGGETINVPQEALLAFWQQLRDYGFSMRSIAPGLSRELSYLIPLFSQLQYVIPIRVAETYEKLSRSPTLGLQILPSAFRQTTRLTQTHLFSVA